MYSRHVPRRLDSGYWPYRSTAPLHVRYAIYPWIATVIQG